MTTGSSLPDLKNVAFSSVFSDHMFVAEYRNGEWNRGRIERFGTLSLPPSVTALHYGISIFEGMKAHRSRQGTPLLFRPAENARRFQRSALRLVMPPVPETLFLDGVRELVRRDRSWIPDPGDGALYIRPLQFSDDPSLLVKPPERCQFVVITLPFAAYFSAPIDVMVSERYARAYPHGTGDIKPAGNYAPALLADVQAREAGCTCAMWLDAVEHKYVEEFGVMNVFFVTDDGVITPPLTGTILPGVTRDSVITLLRDMGHRVREERIAIDDLFAMAGQGSLRECFGTGTAATVSHVRRIRNGDRTIELPAVEQRKVGPAVREKLLRIMTGEEMDRHHWTERL